MPIKISDFLPPAAYPDTLGLKILNQMGDYLKLSIVAITIPVGGAYVDIQTPYTDKLKNFIIAYANTLPDRTVDYGHGVVITYTDKQYVLDALSDPANKLSALIAVIESTFIGTQAGAIIQFNLPNPVPPPPVLGPTPPGQPFLYSLIAGTFLNAIQPVLGEPTPIASQAFETFITQCYAANGLV